MLITSTDYVPQRELKALGLVRGLYIHPTTDRSDKTLTNQTQMMEKSIKSAMDKMRFHAKKLEADAIIGVKIQTQTTAQGTIETLVYGTAVKYKITTYLQQF